MAASSEFGISSKDSAHIMGILRDTLYSDKILAVLREYASNAWDAHREAKKSEVPIEITLPTLDDPVLTIRDRGRGLSHQEVFEIYTQYGASTKRDSDLSVGMLGIGGKSGFSYSDSFTITSWYEGVSRTYVAVLDKSEKGVINLLSESTCPPDETGIQIQIAIRQPDIDEFHAKARDLFQFFIPRPTINTELPDLGKNNKLTSGIIFEEHRGRYNSAEWVAVMGCIPYKINLKQLTGLANYVQSLSGVLFFDIGDVQVNASREELKYSDDTKARIVTKIEALIDEYVTHTIVEIEAEKTPWQKLLRFRVLNRLGLPLPGSYKNKSIQASINFADEKIKTFSMSLQKTTAHYIKVDEKSRIILRDDKRILAGFYFCEHDYIVHPKALAKIDDVKKELDEFLERIGVTGIEVVGTSQLSWHQPSPSSFGGKKYQVTTFRFKPTANYCYGSPWSKYWEIEQRTPTPEDVYVIVTFFKSSGFDLFSLYREDSDFAEAFGGAMPIIYGYKNTSKNAEKLKKIPGLEYREWRKDFASKLMTPKIAEDLLEWRWSLALTSYSYWRDDGRGVKSCKQAYEKLESRLGESHGITQAMKKQVAGMEHILGLYKTNKAISSLKMMSDILDKVSSEPAKIVDFFYKRYPLLNNGLFNLWSNDAEAWVEYVNLVDASGK